MNEMILQLCAISAVCGVILILIPEGGTRNVARILCTAILIICILEPIKGIDFESYASQSAKLHELEAAFRDNSAELEKRLNKAVIEKEYSEYILDKAHGLDISQIDVKVVSRWDEAGLWVPYSAEIYGNWEKTQKEQLKTLLLEELGITFERQSWKLGTK